MRHFFNTYIDILMFNDYNYFYLVQEGETIMTLISEIIFGGFVSKIVNDIGEISKDAIKKAVKQRNEKCQFRSGYYGNHYKNAFCCRR